MKIHAVQTGTVAITTKWREGAGHGRIRLVNTLLDRKWTEPLPIYAFAIEHPEGVIVVDTGETARTSEPGYFPRWQPFFRFAVRERVRPEQEIGPQLEQLGILPSDVRLVVMTHLHTDHAGGMHEFPDSEILVSRAELDYAAGLRGRLRGYPNKRWPAWFRPTLVDLPAVPLGPFPASMALTQAGDVTLVAVPGHTPANLPLSWKTATTRCFSRAIAPTRRRPCCAELWTASARTRPRSGSRTTASSPMQPRRPRYTCRRMTPRLQLGWAHASRSKLRGVR